MFFSVYITNSVGGEVDNKTSLSSTNLMVYTYRHQYMYVMISFYWAQFEECDIFKIIPFDCVKWLINHLNDLNTFSLQRYKNPRWPIILYK